MCMFAKSLGISVLLLIFFLVNSAAYGEAEVSKPLADGFYRQSTDGCGIEVKTEDGRTLRIGEKVEFKILRALIFATNRENTRFSLWMQLPYEQGLEQLRHVWVYQGRIYGQSSSGSSGQEISDMNFSVQTEEAAQAVADHFKIVLRKNRHPGHQMLVTYTPTKDVFAIGDSVEVRLQIKNVGTAEFAFMQGGRNRGSRDNQYTFAATDGDKSIPDTGSCRHLGGIARFVVVKPGEVFEDTVDLQKWFTFREKQYYCVTATYFMEFVDPEKAKRNELESIWSDYATGEFYFQFSGKDASESK